MHLKEIHMENFKTFRKKVVVPVYEGFTGITGPNGSGKSNIADAVLFVLGPRSSKMVRAKRLEDLIFHGNDKLKPANECKVTLVFDNSDRLIPIDSDQVALKRVIRRSASDPNSTLSYFYVNGRVSSQNQFESILMHAHLSAEGYNIVLQGHIAEFINKTPAKIREEIEDIAGIRKYDDEIDAAQAKKAKTEANMEKIQWLLEQIKARLRELKKEKDEAEKYRAAQEQINQTKALLYHVQETAVRGEMETYHQAIDNAEKRKIELRGEVEKLESERTRLDREIKIVEAEIDDITGEEGRKLKAKMDEAKLELMRARDVIMTAEDTISELRSEVVIREQEKKDVSKKLGGLEREISSSEDGIGKINEKIDREQKKITDLEQEQEQTDQDLLDLRRELGKTSKQLEATRDELSSVTLDSDRTRHFLDVKRTVYADTEQMVHTLEYEVSEQKKELKLIEERSSDRNLEKLQKDYMSARSEEKVLGGRMRSLEQEITSLNRIYTQLKVELETSEKINKGLSLAVDDLLTARDKGEIRGIHGTIGELGNVPEEYTLAMEVAAGGRITSVIVEDDEVAARCIERLKKKKLGRATFLPLNKMTVRRPGAKALMIRDDPHVIGLAVDLMEFSEEYRNAFTWAFGDTVVVDDLGTLRRLMGGVRIVTLSGEIAGAGGDITGGSLNQKKGSSGFGKRSASEMETVSSQLKEKMAESDAVTASLNEARDRVSELEAKIRKITTERSDIEEKKKKIGETQRSSNEQLGIKKEEIGTLKGEIVKLEKAATEFEEKIRELGSRVKDLTKERDRLQEKVELATPKAVRDRLRTLREGKDSLLNKRTSLVETRDSARAQLSLFQDRRKELEQRILDIGKAVKKAEEEMASAREKEGRFGKEVKALEAVLTTIDSKTKDLYDRRN
ncbi:MAG: AAA family ATPase, partial [Thermoplasmatota archaeon]